MSDVAFDVIGNKSAEFEIALLSDGQKADMDELSMNELDEANGGILAPLIVAAAFLTGYGAAQFYSDHWGRGRGGRR